MKKKVESDKAKGKGKFRHPPEEQLKKKCSSPGRSFVRSLFFEEMITSIFSVRWNTDPQLYNMATTYLLFLLKKNAREGGDTFF